MASSSNPADPAVVRPLRQLWQVPVFLRGLAVLAGFFLTRPLWRDPLGAHARGLDKARRLLADGRSHRAERLAQAYLDYAGEDGTRSAEAHLLLGWALSHQAQAASGEEALQFWGQARGQLEQADGP